ncbi:hypothetical protein [Burkholderia cepacia]|uniref:hypothetical protein n=1 Tax=Burkholderia cepacia TaxID=292 RepID=UPI001C936EEE|nr:hypothetical protein [Burkholderia cepacia]MBY4715846.1 hypothetical protein [Burkholderia cepacia]MBY4735968.1 hypothetical protein [Burkholderia cepacia]MBY4747644.1 hypothetical protein [Burkholderia cepacia]MBY4760848.1 hypothetical protein [Burkholderia cepacia]MBY4906806.1 hypothetical protein [Burkholderia cepacia]
MREIVQIKSVEARRIIGQLNRMNLDKVEYNYIKNLIARLTVGLKMRGVTPHMDSRLYRGVVFREKPSKVGFLGYPPASIVTNFQRCNPPSNPMFYCSVDPSAIYYELGVQPGDKVFLSKWSVSQEFFINRIAPPDEDDMSDLVRDIVLTFFETKFSQPIHETYSSQYKITSAISEKLSSGELIGDHRVIGAVSYPSVVHPSRSENLAIRTAVVDKCLQLDYVEEILVTNVQGNTISVDRTDFSSNFDGDNIIWTGKPIHWTMGPGTKLVVTAEPDGWIARDENGNVVNPG